MLLFCLGTQLYRFDLLDNVAPSIPLWDVKFTFEIISETLQLLVERLRVQITNNY